VQRFIFLFLLILNFNGKGFTQQQNQNTRPEHHGSLWLGAVAGPSLLVEHAPDSLDPVLQNFFNELRSGWHYGFETEYFFNKYIGAGVKYSRFNTKFEADSILVQIFSSKYYFDISSNMSFHTLAPMVYGRLPLLHNKLSVTGGLGPAWLLYRNIGKVVGDTSMLKGSSPGIASSLFVGYEIIPNLSLGLQTSYIHAFLKKFTKDDGTSQEVVNLDEKDYQNISRFDFSFGIFYTFKRK
jgi:hypothetical protein